MGTGGQVRALLLNSSYEPLKVVSWQKALILWFQGKVEILEFHTFFINSVTKSFQLPSVLRLKSFVRPAKNSIRFCRENVYLRDNYTCQYCAKKAPLKELTLDHVIPASKAGKKDWDNVVTACRKCNQIKANRTPKTANMPLLKEPKMPHWLPVIDIEINKGNCPPTWSQYIRKAG